MREQPGERWWLRAVWGKRGWLRTHCVMKEVKLLTKNDRLKSDRKRRYIVLNVSSAFSFSRA